MLKEEYVGNKILAVVVTYNRLECLKVCLDAIRAQTFKDFEILVVNNGSNDGTREFLDSQADLNSIHQENLGGAGGFYSGMKYMIENEYDWIWMMDDDGIPDKDELKYLVKYSLPFSNALVIDKDDKTKLAFGSELSNAQEAKKCGIIENFIHPFNGTFINRLVIERIGLIKKEMFIWGDEEEYILRAKKMGIIPQTVTTAIHYHPAERGMYKRVLPFFDRWKILVKPSSLSHIYYRNKGFLHFHFKERRIDLLWSLWTYPAYFIRTLQFKELLKFIKYYFLGALNRY